ncbi:hypothetical protein IAT38_003824 [Cryptococcus sp. DSM 104549]
MAEYQSSLVFDDTSAYISYAGVGWDIQTNSDPFLDKYKNTTFHSTVVDGDTATIMFIGTDVQLFGGKRPNHGFYSGYIDGGDKQYFNGTARNPELYQTVLFEAHGLENKTHTVVLTNAPSWDRAGGSWMDLDFVAINGTAIAPGSVPTETQSSSSSTTATSSTSASVSVASTPSQVAPAATTDLLPQGSIEAIQLAATIAPSLANAQRPVIDYIASNSGIRLTANPSPALAPLLFLSFLFFHGLRRLSVL